VNVAPAAVNDILDLVHDRRVGIIHRLEVLPAEAGAPDFVHVVAHVADPAVYGGERGSFTVAAAGVDRAAATARATALALARYCAALYERAGLPLASPAEATFPIVEPHDFTLYSRAQYAEPGFPFVPFETETPVRWASAIELSSGRQMFLPAAFIWFPFRYLRKGGDLPIAPVTASGLACGDNLADALYGGLCEVMARDGLAIFWQSRTAPPQVRIDGAGERLAGLVARFVRTGDRLAVLDVAGDHRLPCFAAVLISEHAERPAFVFAAAAGLDPAAAIAEALVKLAETQRITQEARRRWPPPSAANNWEDVIDRQDHLNFAADPFNRELVAFMLSSEDRRNLLDYDAAPSGSSETDLATSVTRVKASGHEVYAANLTSEDVTALSLAVCRVVVPGYQPLFPGHRVRALGGTRLYEVPQKLGYRGIPRGSSGNAAPYPFA
jgi:ribosomal protein S12 methylthiotransferase accessory factor